MRLKSILGDERYQQLEENMNSCTEALNREGGNVEKLLDNAGPEAEDLRGPLEMALNKVEEVVVVVEHF